MWGNFRMPVQLLAFLLKPEACYMQVSFIAVLYDIIIMTSLTSRHYLEHAGV